MTPKCPDCAEPLWLRACKCGWQAPVAELKFSDDAAGARAAYARQAELYAVRTVGTNHYRPQSLADLFREPLPPDPDMPPEG